MSDSHADSRLGSLVLKDVIERIVSAKRFGNKYYETKALGAWTAIVGGAAASYTETLYIREQTLFVRFRIGTLKNEMMMRRQRLINAINQAAGKEVVNKIVFL